MNLSQPIKKMKKRLRESYYEVYFYLDSLLNQYVVPYLWTEIHQSVIKTGDLVHLKHKFTIQKYHGIVLNEPRRVITTYGLISGGDNIRHVVDVQWNYGKKTFTRCEFCDNLEVISGGK